MYNIYSKKPVQPNIYHVYCTAYHKSVKINRSYGRIITKKHVFMNHHILYTVV